jgi:hypothetical protein
MKNFRVKQVVLTSVNQTYLIQGEYKGKNVLVRYSDDNDEPINLSFADTLEECPDILDELIYQVDVARKEGDSHTEEEEETLRQNIAKLLRTTISEKVPDKDFQKFRDFFFEDKPTFAFMAQTTKKLNKYLSKKLED